MFFSRALIVLFCLFQILTDFGVSSMFVDFYDENDPVEVPCGDPDVEFLRHRLAQPAEGGVAFCRAGWAGRSVFMGVGYICHRASLTRRGAKKHSPCTKFHSRSTFLTRPAASGPYTKKPSSIDGKLTLFWHHLIRAIS